MKNILLSLTIFFALVFFSFYKVEANDVSINQEINQDRIIALESINNSDSEENSVKTVKEDIEVKSSANEEESTEVEWTDFSNAKFELKKDGISGANLEISGIKINNNSGYYLFITSDNSKPDIDMDSDALFNKGIILKNIADSSLLVAENYLRQYVELNQDLYATVVQYVYSTGSGQIVSYGNKINRYKEAKDINAFFSSFISDERDQIVTTFTHDRNHNRKMQVKIGKITDISVLKKIQDKNSAGFEELLNFAKSNSGIYNEILDADKDDWYAIEYNADLEKPEGNAIINLNGLENKEYYYLYIKLDDENGKYISNEAVTLAQAKVSLDVNKWTLMFYGTSDFKWTEWNTSAPIVDSSVVQTSLPHTGIKYILYGGIISAITAIGIFAYKKYKYYNF